MSAIRTMYMHTLDGRPATFDGNQIVFVNEGRYARDAGTNLCESVAEIHEQRAASVSWRESRGFRGERWNYGYVRVAVPL